MKTLSLSNLQRQQRSGFTLMELMAVVAIMATLAALTLVGFKAAQVTSSRNRTAAFHRAIISGLEQYFSDNGEYPTPKDPAATGVFQGKKYGVGGAKMLYQAMSGDGDDQIVLGSPKLGASDGKIMGDEVKYVKLTEMPREMRIEAEGGWVLVDGFNHPFQYTKGPDRPRPGQPLPEKSSVNNTYDLWSYAETDMNTTATDLPSKENVKTSGKWIKNW